MINSIADLIYKLKTDHEKDLNEITKEASNLIREFIQKSKNKNLNDDVSICRFTNEYLCNVIDIIK